ncbi:MAG TPA: toll/interleukin-1 receptor domain-containing protein [Pyrinomonadaceae bacterium]|nr:toll/interleukin-1 receptor domain-containing protein [Pyrinomonadaceae bacterium]
MKIFISWSGERSKAIATALKLFLSDVFLDDVQTWMSDHDIGAGARWSTDLSNELESSNFGVLCLTPENLNAPWLLFEAGSLAKVVSAAYVVPYRLNLTATDVGYPLAQFQGVDADRQGTYRLLKSINSVRDDKFPESKLDRVFERWWPDLEEQLINLETSDIPLQVQRPDRVLLEEILQLMRAFFREANFLPKVTSPDKNNEMAIYDVNETIIAAMSDVDVTNYLGEVRDRYYEARFSDNERALIQKMQMAEGELERRRLNKGAQKSVISSEEREAKV